MKKFLGIMVLDFNVTRNLKKSDRTPRQFLISER
jgi:hypothetical protein